MLRFVAGQIANAPAQFPARLAVSPKHQLVRIAPFAASTDRRFKFYKSRQLFIRTHHETLSVVAMCVSSPDCSPVGINR